MERSFFLDLASRGLRFPVGTHLVLHEHPEPEKIMLDGRRLGEVYIQSAQRYRTPLAIPLMDLTVEKEAMLSLLGIDAQAAGEWHFQGCPTQEQIDVITAGAATVCTPRMRANLDAITHVARHSSLIPVGMSIGPFSLLVKIINDPITAIYLAGTGSTAEEDEEVRAVERGLELCMAIILPSIRAQVAAGAKAIFLCEPAANRVYISPKQMDEGVDLFERYVMTHNRRIKKLLDEQGVDLILHDCGELTDAMIAHLASLDPAILSLGSPRKLWEISHLVPATTVLFGNLPTKQFYSEQVMPMEKVEALTSELVERMAALKRPFILGSECDVLSVPDSHKIIQGKIERMLTLNCACHPH